MTTRTDELVSFDAAVEAAVAELDLSLPESEEPAEPPVDQADIEEGEQAEEPTESATQPQEAEEAEDLFADLESEEEESSEPEVDWEAYTFEVPGEEEPKSLQELRDGFLRNRDYTQGKQAIAEQRKANEQAIKLWEALQSDPVGVVSRLAQDAGLIEEGSSPAAQIEFSPLKTAEAVQAEVDRRVAEEVAKHPSVIAAREVEVRQMMETAFSTIEEKHDVKLSTNDRRAILVRAQASGTPDLELVFNALMSEKQAKAARADGLRAAAPARSTGRTVEEPVSDKPASIEEAFTMAQVSLGA